MRVNTIICDDLYTYEILKEMNSEFIDALYLNEDEEECEELEEEYDDTRVVGGEQLSMLTDLGLFVVEGKCDVAEAALCDEDKKCEEQVDNEQADVDDDLDSMLDSMLDEDLGEEPKFVTASKATVSSKASKPKAPVILSMRDYIMDHYADQMCLELGACLLAGMLKTYGCSVTEVYDDTFKIGRMSFWRETSRTCFAYVQLAIDAIEQRRGAERIERRNYSAIISFDMTEEKVKTEITYGLYDPDDEKEWAKTLYKLDDYLVPIMTKQQIEEAAWKLHQKNFPTAGTGYEEIRREYDACNLARSMGLEVMTLSLHKKNKTKSMLFFCADKVLVDVHYPDGEKGKKWVKVPADCIVINLNAVPKDNYQLEVFHECIHYDFHYMFYRLQEMHVNDLRQLKREPVTGKQQEWARKSINYLEYQARRGSFALMMPLPVMRPLVDELIEKYQKTSHHAGDMFERIGRQIHRDRGHAKFRIRARLIQMGHIEAKGSLNYVDGRYIEPFAFKRENADKNQTFVVDSKTLHDEYENNEEFRKLMSTGRYVHVDGHLCRNDPQYVVQTKRGPRMTIWGNAHVDECCLRFISIYEENEISEYEFGRLFCDEEYIRNYYLFAGKDADMTEAQRIEAIDCIIEEMPPTFHGALKYLIDMAGKRLSDLESEAQISESTLKRLRKEERRDYSLDQVVAICITLHLPPPISEELVDRAGYNLRRPKSHRIYKQLLDCKFMDTVDEVQSYLSRNNLPLLRLKTTMSAESEPA